MNIIQQIIKNKKKEIVKRKKKISLENLKEDVQKNISKDRDFKKCLLLENGEVAIIGEIKLSSPSAGILIDKKDIEQKVLDYGKAGVNAISIVTDKKFFNGDLEFISDIKKLSLLPIFCKDFILDSYQVYEAKVKGADALLLIARIVDEKVLNELVDLCQKLDIEPVVEIASKEDLEKAVKTKTDIIAVNARDLDTFEVNVKKACELLDQIPKKFIRLGFSGVKSREEVQLYKKSGARGVLVGTGLTRAENVNKFISNLKSQNSKLQLKSKN